AFIPPAARRLTLTRLAPCHPAPPPRALDRQHARLFPPPIGRYGHTGGERPRVGALALRPPTPRYGKPVPTSWAGPLTRRCPRCGPTKLERRSRQIGTSARGTDEHDASAS